MQRLDPTVKRETAYIAVFTLVGSALMEAVYLLLSRWDLTVLYGNLLGAAAAVANFLLLGITVQCALGKDVKEAQTRMKFSQMGRMLLLFAVALVGYLLPCFHTLAVVLPYLFPRVAIAVWSLKHKS